MNYDFPALSKLNSKIIAGTLPSLPLDENPFADGSAHLFERYAAL